MIFYNTGYGYEKSDEGYVVTHLQVQSKRGGKFIDVWTALDFAESGKHILNGADILFYTREDAIAACDAHHQLLEKIV